MARRAPSSRTFPARCIVAVRDHDCVAGVLGALAGAWSRAPAQV